MNAVDAALWVLFALLCIPLGLQCKAWFNAITGNEDNEA